MDANDKRMEHTQQQLHAAQLAVAEINAGYTLADSKGGLDVFGKDTSRPPTETIHGVKNNGGAMGSTKIVYDEEPDSINMAQGYEHLRFKPPALWQMHTTTNWMEEYQTPRAKTFIQRYRKMFPNEPYIAQETQTTYLAIHLYAKAVRKAGTTDQGKVAAALESGMGMEAPEGPVFMDPATHHLTHEIRLARAEKDHSITFVHTWQAIEPWWTRRLGVNLVRNPEHKQYTPADDPYFKEATKSKT